MNTGSKQYVVEHSIFLTRTEWQDERRAQYVDDLCWLREVAG